MSGRSDCAVVRGNDWTALVPGPDETWTPSRTVSICIPARNPGPGLARTLRCLDAQTYPAHLIEIIVADDGSATPIDVPQRSGHAVRVVRQERSLDFGAGQARNLAAAAATGDILFFLDADVIPERQVVESYARWFDRCELAVPLGLCSFVEVDGLDDDTLFGLVRDGGMARHFAGGEVGDQEWRELHFRRTRDLRIETVDAFRVTIGATLAVTAAQFHEVGGFPELGIRGAEDTVFGYRVHANGGVLVTERDAMHWHQGRRTLAAPGRRRIHEARDPYLRCLIPVEGFRDGEAASETPVEAVPTARVRLRGDGPARDASDRSVRQCGPLDASLDSTGDPAATFDPAFAQVDLPAGLLWTPTTADRILEAFAAHPVGVLKALCGDADGSVVTIARTRALRRARQVRPDEDPITVAAELFGLRWTTADQLDLEVIEPADSTGASAESADPQWAEVEPARSAWTARVTTWLYNIVLVGLNRAVR